MRALERAPGVSVRRTGGIGQPAYVQVRGANPRQLVVLLNGVRVRLPVGLGFDIGSLSALGLDAVRIHRGPAGVLWGAGALGGVLALSARPPEATEAEARVGAGSFGRRGAQARAGTSERKEWGPGREPGRLSAGLAAGWRAGRGDFSFVDAQSTTARRVNNDWTRLQAVGSMAWAGPAQRAGLSVLVEHGRRGAPGPSEFQDAFGKARVEETRLIVATDSVRRGAARGDSWSIDLYRNIGLSWRGERYENPSSILGQLPFARDGYGFTSQLSTGAKLVTEAGVVAHAGVETRRERYAARRGERGRRELSAARTIAAPLAAIEVPLAGEAISVTAAARADVVVDEEDERLLATGAVGAIWRAAPWARVAANLARLQRAPDLDELYLDLESVRGDPALEPERAWSADLGGRIGDERASVELVGFLQRTRDLIAFAPLTAYLFAARNFELVRTRGAEAAARAGWGWGDLRASYTWVDARRPEVPGAPMLPNRPRHAWDAEASARWRGVEARLGARYRGEITLDPFGSATNPGWLSVDAALSAGWRGWGARLDATNLLDYKRAVDTLQRPLPGRAVYFSLARSTP